MSPNKSEDGKRTHGRLRYIFTESARRWKNNEVACEKLVK